MVGLWLCCRSRRLEQGGVSWRGAPSLPVGSHHRSCRAAAALTAAAGALTACYRNAMATVDAAAVVRWLDAGERLLACAPLGVAVHRRHLAARCSWCFATRETEAAAAAATADSGGGDAGIDGDENTEGLFTLRCDACACAHYCSEQCRAAARPTHELECATLRAVEGTRTLKKDERALVRLLVSVIASLRTAPVDEALQPEPESEEPEPEPELEEPAGGSSLSVTHHQRAQQLPAVGRTPSLEMLLDLFPDQRQSVGAAKRAKQRGATF
jgi:hypothetical protein